MTAENYLEENLSVTHYRNGDEIPQVTDPKEWGNLTTGAWCHYDNNPDNEEKYGKLYNWYAVNDARGLAPHGYHVPTDEEWYSLKLDGVYGGYRYFDGTFNNIGDYGYWWSSTEGSTTGAWSRSLYCDYSDVGRGSVDKRLGFSVRCVRDLEITDSLESKTEISDSTIVDKIDGIIFDLPYDDKIKLWELIDKLILENKTERMYSEEEVKSAFKKGFYRWNEPIEISDKEIEKVSNTLGDDYYASELIMWEKGAKWYRDRLKESLLLKKL